MSQITLEVDELSEDQIELVKHFITLLGTSRQKKEAEARAELQILWQQLKDTDPDLSEEEVAKLTEEAVASVRAKA